MSVQLKPAPYKTFGDLLAKLRSDAALGNQKDFAGLLGITQQTVSRWEKGLSRPRSKDLPVIAKLLKANETDLFVAAGYSPYADNERATATTFDRPLPLHALTPESFERFCTYFLDREYRSRGGRATRYGGSGHKQDGIDIFVKGPFGTHSFQCKRVEEFGAQKVHTAVATQTFKADQKILLLSNVASPKARDAMRSHATWELWDREDITLRFRQLPIIDQVDLVDIFFQGQRQDLLGHAEAGPLVSAEDFYKPFLEEDRLFNHRWNLVGRDAELTQLKQSVLDESVRLTLLVGPPGNGKTRILREIIEQVQAEKPALLVRFVSPTEDVKATHLDKLGTGQKLLVADDVHDREDVGTLLQFSANPENNTRLLFALRPYGSESLKFKAAKMSLSSSSVKTVEVNPQTKADAKLLATEVLSECDGPVEMADVVADATHGTPLVTVLGAQLVARDKIHPSLLVNVDDFKNHVLGTLQDIIAGNIVTGHDVPRIQSILGIVALVQPIIPDDPALIRLLKEVAGVDQPDAARLLRVLSEAGVLFKRGLRYRLAPDLLADAIIQRNFINPDGTANEKVSELFDLVGDEHLKHFLVNLGRLEWRMKMGETGNSVLLASISSKLQWYERYRNPHLDAVEAVAYFQPRLALDFAARLISQGHGDNSAVCEMVRNAAFNFDYLEEACKLLWKAGCNDKRSVNQHPSHGIRILKELAKFQPNKPIEFVQAVVRFALQIFRKPKVLDGIYTPFNILEGVLITEMETTTSTSRGITISTYSLPLNVVGKAREEVVGALLGFIADGSPRTAFLAIGTLAEALRGPMHKDPNDDLWEKEHIQILHRLKEALQEGKTHPIVLVKAAATVRWHAYHGPDATRPNAEAIVSLANCDFQSRLVRGLIDGWGHETWPIGHAGESKAHEVAREELVKELRTKYPEASALYDQLNYWVREIDQVAVRGYGSPHMLINHLLVTVSGFAREVFQRYLKDADEPLSAFAGAALSQLIGGQSKDEVYELFKRAPTSPEKLRLIAEAYASYESQGEYSDDDIAIIRLIFRSSDKQVIRYATTLALQVARRDPTFAVELISTVDFVAAGDSGHDFFMWLSHQDTIPESAIREDQWRKLITGLTYLERLDDYWIREFLKKVIRVLPTAVIDLVKARLQISMQTENWSFAPLHKEHSGDGLGLMNHETGERILREFLDWAAQEPSNESMLYTIGNTAAGLCGRYESRLLDMLLSWMAHGTDAHISIVSAILRNAQSDFIYKFPQYVRSFLYTAELISDGAVEEVIAAISTASWSGPRGTVPGEPYPEDVRLEKYAKEMLSTLSRVDPGYDLFSGLLREAERGIARQRREKQAMDEEEQ